MTPPSVAAAPAANPLRSGQGIGASPRERVGGGPRPLTVPRGPRRVSGPARRGTSEQPARRRTRPETPIAVGLLAGLESLSRHRLLDRLIRGRIWIALVAFALIGIVTLQLGLLKLNGEIGRALEREALLQRENAALSIENSEMAAGERVESLAAGIGMEFVPLGAQRFLAANPGIDTRRAAAALGTQSQPPARGSEEAPGAGSTGPAPSAESAATGEPSTTPAASAEPSATPSAATAEPSGPPSTTSSSTGESPRTPSAESKTQSAESTTASGTGEPSAAGSAGSGSAEGPAAGGTPASSAGG